MINLIEIPPPLSVTLLAEYNKSPLMSMVASGLDLGKGGYIFDHCLWIFVVIGQFWCGIVYMTLISKDLAVKWHQDSGAN